MSQYVMCTCDECVSVCVCVCVCVCVFCVCVCVCVCLPVCVPHMTECVLLHGEGEGCFKAEIRCGHFGDVKFLGENMMIKHIAQM